MKTYVTPKLCFGLCKLTGFSLLFAFWIKSGETAGFFLLLFLTVMALLRRRVPRMAVTVFVDLIICTVLAIAGQVSALAMAIPLFEAMALGYYGSALGLMYAFYRYDMTLMAFLALAMLSGFFLHRWETERIQKQRLRDEEAGRYYELESLQNDLLAALAQIEQMTTVHERARIARDIHDNAGHEIVSAYMAFQTVRALLPPNDETMLRLYDTALERLDSGTAKIREAVHNLGTVSILGVDRLREQSARFTVCPIDFQVYGDTTRVPMYVWRMLESCLSEALTNISRHALATKVTVELDAAPQLIRMCVTNDGVAQSGKMPGRGLRNLRHRAAAIGGSLSVDSGPVFKLICVIPLRIKDREAQHENTDR